jgi:hypothetical protein
MNKRKFFVAIFIDVPDSSYAGLSGALKTLSDNDYEIVHLHRTGAFFLVNAKGDAGDIAHAISDFVRADDRFLILECADDGCTRGLSKAANWLQRHETQK